MQLGFSRGQYGPDVRTFGRGCGPGHNSRTIESRLTIARLFTVVLCHIDSGVRWKSTTLWAQHPALFLFILNTPTHF